MKLLFKLGFELNKKNFLKQQKSILSNFFMTVWSSGDQLTEVTFGGDWQVCVY